MQEAAERAQRYRRRADELRTMAADWKNAETRVMLQRIAKDYEKLAALLEDSTL
ncbi:MAG TPA: hypothetical protein VGF97_11125 [Rhizomicrobium sp.]|jgi:hypothetical protein